MKKEVQEPETDNYLLIRRAKNIFVRALRLCDAYKQYEQGAISKEELDTASHRFYKFVP